MKKDQLTADSYQSADETQSRWENTWELFFFRLESIACDLPLWLGTVDFNSYFQTSQNTFKPLNWLFLIFCDFKLTFSTHKQNKPVQHNNFDVSAWFCTETKQGKASHWSKTAVHGTTSFHFSHYLSFWTITLRWTSDVAEMT